MRSPDPHALRRDRPGDAPWTHLPPRPADAEVPDWPLTKATARELTLWKREWNRPQASQWLINDEAQGVALFVRLLARAEKPDSPVTLQKYIREWRHELGISASGAALRRWLMANETPTSRPASVTSLASRPSARERLGGRPPARERFRRADPPTVEVDDDPAPF